MIPGTLILRPAFVRLSLPNEKLSKINPYIRFKLGDQRIKTKTLKNFQSNPSWKDQSALKVRNASMLTLELWDKEILKDILLGSATINLQEVLSKGKPKLEEWIPIVHKQNQAGAILLEMAFYTESGQPPILQTNLQSTTLSSIYSRRNSAISSQSTVTTSLNDNLANRRNTLPDMTTMTYSQNYTPSTIPTGSTVIRQEPQLSHGPTIPSEKEQPTIIRYDIVEPQQTSNLLKNPFIENSNGRVQLPQVIQETPRLPGELGFSGEKPFTQESITRQRDIPVVQIQEYSQITAQPHNYYVDEPLVRNVDRNIQRGSTVNPSQQPTFRPEVNQTPDLTVQNYELIESRPIQETSITREQPVVTTQANVMSTRTEVRKPIVKPKDTGPSLGSWFDIDSP